MIRVVILSQNHLAVKAISADGPKTILSDWIEKSPRIRFEGCLDCARSYAHYHSYACFTEGSRCQGDRIENEPSARSHMPRDANASPAAASSFALSWGSQHSCACIIDSTVIVSFELGDSQGQPRFARLKSSRPGHVILPRLHAVRAPG